LIPVLPFFAIEDLGLTPSQMGTVMSASAITQFFGSGICGRLSDAVGRRPLLVIFCLWSALSNGSLALVTSYRSFLVVRCLQGLGGSANVLCDAYILDIVPAHKRPAFFGVFGCVALTAFVCGPACAVALMQLKFTRYNIFLISSGLCMVATLFSIGFLEESLELSKRRPVFGSVDEGAEVSRKRDVISLALVSIWLYRFFTAMGQGILYAMYAFIIKDFFGWSERHLVGLMAASGVAGMVLQLVIYPQFAKWEWQGSSLALALGSASGAVGYMLLAEPVVVVHVAGMLGLTVAAGLMEPSIPVLLGCFAGDRYSGFASGVVGSMRSLASVGAPVLGGILYERGVVQACLAGCIFFTTGTLCSLLPLFTSP